MSHTAVTTPGKQATTPGTGLLLARDTGYNNCIGFHFLKRCHIMYLHSQLTDTKYVFSTHATRSLVIGQCRNGICVLL